MGDRRNMEDLVRKTRSFLKKNMRKDRLLIILLSGILIMVIAVPVSDQKGDNGEVTVSGDSGMDFSMGEYSRLMEQKLASSLSKIQGAGEVAVMITWKSSSEKIVEKDEESTNESLEETDSQGGSRTTRSIKSSGQSVYIKSGDVSEDGEPYVTKEISPVVEGVIVIAAGGDQPVVVQNITEAVQALFDIDTHKIKVMKGN